MFIIEIKIILANNIISMNNKEFTKEVWIDCLLQSLVKNPKTKIEIEYNKKLLDQIKYLQLNQQLMKYRCYRKENTEWLEQTKDFDTFIEALDFIDNNNWRGYIVLYDNKKQWTSDIK